MFHRIFWTLLAACLVASAALGDGRFSRILLTNETPNFKVTPTIEFFGKDPEAFKETSTGKFEYQFRLSEQDWFNTADIKLVWNDAYQNNDGSRSDFEQRVKLRLRYDFPKEFAARVFFSNNRSQDEIGKLERQTNDTEQWKNFFRAWQIAAYYRETLGNQHPLFRRTSRIFFNAAYQLAVTDGYFVVMSKDAITFVEEAFKGKGRDFSKQISTAKSAYWEDLEQIEPLIKKGECSKARMLLIDLKKAKTKEPDLFALRYWEVPNLLEEKKSFVDSKCPEN